MSDTPRTDAAAYDVCDATGPVATNLVDSDFARTLERELNAARAELAELKDKQDIILRDYSVIVADLQAIQDEEDSKLGDMANRSAHYAIKAIADLEGALMDANGLNTKLRLELAALKAAAPEPLDRPDRSEIKYTGHTFCNLCGTAHWMYGNCPTTPPPVPEKEVQS